MCCQIGGTVGISPLTVGGDFNVPEDSELDKIYYGITTNVGIGTPCAELHIEWEETISFTKTQFNIFDVIDGFYIKIMEW